MRRRYDFETGHPVSETVCMQKTPKEILEWLCEGHEQYWKPDGTLNIYALHQSLARWGKERESLLKENVKTRKIPSQSTMARLYAGDSAEFKTSTATTLSDFFGVPVAMIRGEVLWNPKEDWGMDLTYREVTLLYQLRQLQPEQRRAVAKLIEEMLPENAERAPVMMMRRGTTPLLPTPKPDKH